jgi:glycosyltransferase involved in cell wall biosynthesis
MACGVPVIASKASSLPEVVGEAGMLIDPHDVGALSGALDHLLSDDSLRRRMVKKGTARARQFTWARAAQQTWDLYERVLGNR